MPEEMEKKEENIQTNKQVSAQDFLNEIKGLNLEQKTDKYGRVFIKKNKKTVTIVTDRKKGFSYRIKTENPGKSWKWKSQMITTKEQMAEKVKEISSM